MTKNPVAIFVVLFVCFSSCSNEPDPVTGATAKIEHSIDSAYTDWQSAEGEKIRFRYPSNWILKKKEIEGGTRLYGLIEKTEKDFGDFFELEIYEMRTLNLPFKEFKFGAARWLNKRFDNKIMVRNTEDVNFKGAEARKYEIDMPGKNGYDPAEMYAINGVSRYYLFFYFKYEKSNLIIPNIMNSIIFYK